MVFLIYISRAISISKITWQLSAWRGDVASLTPRIWSESGKLSIPELKSNCLDWRNLMKVFLRFAIVAIIAAGIIGMTPDFIRYMKIRSM